MKYLLLISLILPLSSKAISQAELLTDPEFIKAVAAQVAQQIKEVVPATSESISNNVMESGSGFISGCYDLGVGASRLVLNGSKGFAEVSKWLANHYICLGGVMVSGVMFYFYVWPKIKINVNYCSDARPAR